MKEGVLKNGFLFIIKKEKSISENWKSDKSYNISVKNQLENLKTDESYNISVEKAIFGRKSPTISLSA